MQEFNPDEADAIIGASPHPSGITMVARGSAKYCCMVCHGDTWLSPQSQLLLKRRPEMRVYCFNCLQEKKVPNDKDGSAPVVGRPSREFLAADIGEALADLIIKEDVDPFKK